MEILTQTSMRRRINKVESRRTVVQITLEKMLLVSCDSFKPSGDSFMIPLTASQNLIAKLFGQQTVEVLGECSKLKAEN